MRCRRRSITSNRYLTGLARFGFTLLAGGLLLKLLAGAFPTDHVSTLGAHFHATLGALFFDALRSTVAIAGRGLTIALPVALLTGLLAGLQPGGRFDSILMGTAAVLAGLPGVPVVLTVVCALSLDLGWLGMGGSVHIALGLAIFPWVAIAIRNTLASIVHEGDGVHPARAFTALFGAVLSQSGNIAMASLAAGVYLLPDDGMLRLLELAGRLADPVMLYTLLAPTLLVVGLLHLTGDMLTTFVGGAGLPARPLSRFWTVAGALLLALGLAAFAADAPGAANTWLVALGALLVAAVAGFALAFSGPLLPAQPLPSALAPLIAGLVLPVLAGRSLWVLMAALGLASAVLLAEPLRRLLTAPPGTQRRTAVIAVAGTGLLVLFQVISAQVTLDVMNAGMPTGLANLGEVVRTSLLADPDFQYYWPVLPVLALPASLFLLGMALKAKAGDEIAASPVPDQLPDEHPDQETDELIG